ncbi:Core histone H2A/H2B/H3/H4, putative, partial [Leishmania shawi]
MPTVCSLSVSSRHAGSPPQHVLAFPPHLFSRYIWCDRFPARLRYPATPALLHFSHPRTTMAVSRHAPRKASRVHKAHRKPKRSWNVYVSRSLKAINSHMSISHRAMMIMNSYVTDLLERVASEAASIVRVNKKRTLGA